jgi:hypothetical protein
MEKQEECKFFASNQASDVDKNLAFDKAIKETIEIFVRNEGRPPRILDIDAGATGLLTLLALKHGAEYVLAIEPINHVLLTKVLTQNDKTLTPKKKWAVFPDFSFNCELDPDEKQYDIAMCGSLNTMINSENIAISIYSVVHKDKLIRDFGGHHYIIPNFATMTICPYDCPSATGIVHGVDITSMNSLFTKIYDSKIFKNLEWTPDEAKRICISKSEFKPLSDKITILHEDYANNKITCAKKIQFELKPGPTVVFVLEWIAQLSTNVQLNNTLEYVKNNLSMSNALARWFSWGHSYSFAREQNLHQFNVVYEPNNLLLSYIESKSEPFINMFCESNSQRTMVSNEELDKMLKEIVLKFNE